MHELNRRTLEAIEYLFSENEFENVRNILTRQCWSELSGCEHWEPEEIERIHFAALKVSSGDYRKLESAVAQANQDWRDLLMAAGFGEDPECHKNWQPNSIEPKKVRNP